MTRVALLKGGTSGERLISLKSAEQVAIGLSSEGFDVVEIDTGDPDFVTDLLNAEADVVFICLHGRGGEDGTIQGLCELLQLPYTGSGVLASALAMDKGMAKIVYRGAGVRTPPSITVRAGDAIDPEAIFVELGDDLVVKPAHEGSSLGISFIKGRVGLEKGIAEGFALDDVLILEKFVTGMEATVGVLGNDELTALPTIEILSELEHYDFEAKYTPGMSSHVLPARISPEVEAECRALGIAAHRALGCRGISRSDILIDAEDVPWVIETNTIPGMTPMSLVPDAARFVGIEWGPLCRMLVELALEG